jgi:ketosteroid isomerase-like protein
MNKKIIFIFSFVLIIITACTASEPIEATPAPTATIQSPDIIVKQAIAAWNVGDITSLLRTYSEDATVCLPDWTDECIMGSIEVSAWIEDLVGQNFTIELGDISTNGDKVTVTAQVWADPTRKLGIAPLETNDIYIISDGRITNQTSTLTEESAALYKSAMTAETTKAVILSFVEAVNKGDVEAAMGFIHQDIYVDLGQTLLPGFPTISGLQRVLSTWLEEMIAINMIVEAEIDTITEKEVVVKSKVWTDYLSSIDAAPINIDETYEIQDGQILSWNRIITPESINKVQEGLIKLGVPDSITPEPGEVLASNKGDIVGSWITTISGAGDVHVTLDANGNYDMEGSSGAYWFNEPFLWMKNETIPFPGDVRHSCQDKISIGSYVVYATRSGDRSVALRFIPVLETCMLRATFLGQASLTPDN